MPGQALAIPQAVNLADVPCRNKGLNILLTDKLHKIGELILGQKGLYLSIRPVHHTNCILDATFQ